VHPESPLTRQSLFSNKNPRSCMSFFSESLFHYRANFLVVLVPPSRLEFCLSCIGIEPRRLEAFIPNRRAGRLVSPLDSSSGWHDHHLASSASLVLPGTLATNRLEGSPPPRHDPSRYPFRRPVFFCEPPLLCEKLLLPRYLLAHWDPLRSPRVCE